MKAGIHSSSIEKRGNTSTENEDAIASRRYPNAIRLAVADGASESSYAGLWARLLVRDLVLARLNRRSVAQFDARLKQLGSEWDQDAPTPAAWYAAQKRARGAFATFASATIRANGTWQALAVGDACVFQLRDGRVISSFPMYASKQFSNATALAGTTTGARDRARAHGTWEVGDQFALATDAVAAWILAATERGDRLDDLLGAVGKVAPFRRWVLRQRKAGLLRNDDSTLVTVDLS